MAVHCLASIWHANGSGPLLSGYLSALCDSCRGRLRERVGNASTARADLEAACRLEPGNAEYATSMGLHHRNHGRWPEALAEFDRALQLDPTRGPVYSHRG